MTREERERSHVQIQKAVVGPPTNISELIRRMEDQSSE